MNPDRFAGNENAIIPDFKFRLQPIPDNLKKTPKPHILRMSYYSVCVKTLLNGKYGARFLTIFLKIVIFVVLKTWRSDFMKRLMICEFLKWNEREFYKCRISLFLEKIAPSVPYLIFASSLFSFFRNTVYFVPVFYPYF